MKARAEHGLALDYWIIDPSARLSSLAGGAFRDLQAVTDYLVSSDFLLLGSLDHRSTSWFTEKWSNSIRIGCSSLLWPKQAVESTTSLLFCSVQITSECLILLSIVPEVLSERLRYPFSRISRVEHWLLFLLTARPSVLSTPFLLVLITRPS